MTNGLIVDFSPELTLATRFVLDGQGRIVSTNEPNPTSGPKFCLIQSGSRRAWAFSERAQPGLVREVEALLAPEPEINASGAKPNNAEQIRSLLNGRVDAGPTFVFPSVLEEEPGLTTITQLEMLERYFQGWTPDEIPDRTPIVGIVAEDGYAVSVCFCARRSNIAAEAGLETHPKWRRLGLGARVTESWAKKVRDELGLLPLYSTSWNNEASLAVARKLHLTQAATQWNVF